jgi:hypothetical protein
MDRSVVDRQLYAGGPKARGKDVALGAVALDVDNEQVVGMRHVWPAGREPHAVDGRETRLVVGDQSGAGFAPRPDSAKS